MIAPDIELVLRQIAPEDLLAVLLVALTVGWLPFDGFSAAYEVAVARRLRKSEVIQQDRLLLATISPIRLISWLATSRPGRALVRRAEI